MLKSLLNKLYLSNADAKSIVQEVVDTHAPRILEQLGLAENNDGILDRIEVDAFIPIKGVRWQGRFRQTTTVRGLFGFDGQEYKHGTGVIEINAISIMYFFTKKDRLVHMPIARLFLFRKNYRKWATYILAHEMRHYWQYFTGEAYKHDHIGAHNFMPYQWRWEEQDAHQFGKDYVKSL